MAPRAESGRTWQGLRISGCAGTEPLGCVPLQGRSVIALVGWDKRSAGPPRERLVAVVGRRFACPTLQALKTYAWQAGFAALCGVRWQSGGDEAIFPGKHWIFPWVSETILV